MKSEPTKDKVRYDGWEKSEQIVGGILNVELDNIITNILDDKLDICLNMRDSIHLALSDLRKSNKII